MKMYEIKATKVTYDRGLFNGYEVIGRTVNPNKVEEMITEFRNEHQVNSWWMSYRKDENKNIEITVDEYEVEE